MTDFRYAGGGVRELDGITALVTGVTRGFGRAVAEALIEAGATVAGAGPGGALLASALGERFVPVGALSGTAPDDVLRRHDPRILVIAPEDRRLDPRAAFEWTDAALRLPMREGGLILAVSGESPDDAVGCCGGAVSLGALAAHVAWETRQSWREGVRLWFVSVLVPPAGAAVPTRWRGLEPALGEAGYEVAVGAEVTRLAARFVTGPGKGGRVAHSYEMTARGLVASVAGVRT